MSDLEAGYTRLFAHRLALPAPPQPIDAAAIPARGGVYALTDEAGKLIQLLGAESLRRSVTSRLSRPPAGQRSRRAELRSVARTLWWQPTTSRFETSFVYLNIARQVLGRGYRRQLAFGPAWFAVLDMKERFPRWRVESNPFGQDVRPAGPFVTRKQCGRFIEILEDVFDLCREHHILIQYPGGTPCAYLDMGKCPAPCNGSISPERYRKMLADSARFALGDAETTQAALQQEMAAAAASLRFEVAKLQKDKLDRIVEALSLPGRLCKSVSDFSYLIVQRGLRSSTIKPFFVKHGDIEVGGEVPLHDLEPAATAWTEKMGASDNAPACNDGYLTECIWLVSSFLAAGARAPGVFISAPQCHNIDTVISRVRESFHSRVKHSAHSSDRPDDCVDSKK